MEQLEFWNISSGNKTIKLSGKHSNDCGCSSIGQLLQAKYQGHVETNSEYLNKNCIPISKHKATINLKSKLICCKRTQFPIIEAYAITVHKS